MSLGAILRYQKGRTTRKICTENGRKFKQSRANSVQYLNCDHALIRTWSVGFYKSVIGLIVIPICFKAQVLEESRYGAVTHLCIGSGIYEYNKLLPCALMQRCVSMKAVRMTLQEGKLCGDLTIRACDDLACSKKIDPQNRSVIIRCFEKAKKA